MYPPSRSAPKESGKLQTICLGCLRSWQRDWVKIRDRSKTCDSVSQLGLSRNLRRNRFQRKGGRGEFRRNRTDGVAAFTFKRAGPSRKSERFSSDRGLRTGCKRKDRQRIGS